MTPDELSQVLAEAQRALSGAAEQNWSGRAGPLEWTCRQTVDHMIDCVFSYAMQIAARAPSEFLPFNELHANDDASNHDLIGGLRALGQIFLDVVACAPSGTVASDGVLCLDLGDWYARAGYELALHTQDVTSGLRIEWRLDGGLCGAIYASPSLWMFDQTPVLQAQIPGSIS